MSQARLDQSVCALLRSPRAYLHMCTLGRDIVQQAFDYFIEVSMGFSIISIDFEQASEIGRGRKTLSSNTLPSALGSCVVLWACRTLLI